jgi:glycosyltransferase involved in cell wall biosynthesis
MLDRAARRIEAANLRRADGVVVLTRHAVDKLRWRHPSLPALSVIPTCTDVSVFRPRTANEEPEFGLVFSGSLGTWYAAKEMLEFARVASDVISGPTLFLALQPEELRRLGPTPEAMEIRTVEPAAVAEWLRRARALFFFSRRGFSKYASCPTKFAESLASGLPVVCNRGIGDLDDIIEREGVGVLVDRFSEDAYVAAARRLRRLLDDPGLADRCRNLAETRFSVKLGIESYANLYSAIAAATGSRSRREPKDVVD